MAIPILTPAMKVEVGKFYMVPCLQLVARKNTRWYGYNGKHTSADSDGWTPIIGPEHHDREHIEFPAMHFHVDVRFLSGRVIQRHNNPLRHRPAEVNAMTLPVSTWSDGIGGNKPLEFVRELRRKKCYRVMPDFPPGKHSPKWAKLEAAHAGCKLKPGNICPHRGIDLTPFIKEDGTVICPGHGLRWDTKSGDLLPHHAEVV